MRRVEYEDKEYLIFTRSGMTLLAAARERGVPIECNCEGDHSDARCALKFPLDNMYLLTPVTPLERKTLGENKIKVGWRLACQALFK